MAEWIRFAKEAAYKTRTGIVKIIGGVPVAVFKTISGFKGYIAVCTHKYHVLCVRELINGRYILCQGHGERFNVNTGEPIEGLANEPIKEVEVKVEDGVIYVAKPGEAIVNWVANINKE